MIKLKSIPKNTRKKGGCSGTFFFEFIQQHVYCYCLFFSILLSLQTLLFATASIPRSTNTRHYSVSQDNNDNNNINNPPWNKSPNIDSEGFLTNFYTRIQGEWESEANIGGKYVQLNNQVLIRQVPGDGNCLFHSITVAMSLLVNSTHVDMVGSSKHKNNYDLNHLYQHSQFLRHKAVEVLSNNPRRLLFLQGNEYLRARDLVNAAAAQYDLTGDEYCELMRMESYWGGGPEIVALCNYLKRPIHVYELCGGQQQQEDLKEDMQEDQEDQDQGQMQEGYATRSMDEHDNEEIEENLIGPKPRRKSHNNLCHTDVSENKIPTNRQFQLRRMVRFYFI